MTTTPQAAYELAGNLGWRVHPCRGKVPLLEDWPARATSDLDVIDELFAEYPGAAVGIATGAASGIVVVDVDDPEAFGAFCHEHALNMPPTPTATTPSGGIHYFFQHPGGTVPNRVRFVPGADLRGDGGQVIAPSQSGRSWAPSLTPDDVAPAPLPPVLLEALQARPTGTAPPIADEIPTGQRNGALASLAGSMRRRGMTEAEILAALIAVNGNRCRPPLPEDEVQAIAHSVARYEATEAVAGAPDDNVACQFKRTDLGNAERFRDQHGRRVLYCATWGRWFVWDGRRWAPDDTQRVLELGAATARAIWDEAAAELDKERRAALGKHALRSENRQRIEAAVSLASAFQDLAVRTDDLDHDQWSLNVENGTLDLRSGTLRPHNQADLMTKLAPVTFDPAAEAPTWAAFLERVLPDPGVRDFMQRFMGYALTGDVSDQSLLFLWGSGANGKSTFLNAVLHVLGDYGQQAPPDLLIQTSGDRHPTELADLQGMRFVAASEVDEGRRWAEARLKLLTGGDRVTARRMRADFYSFAPSHKLAVAANHRPVVRGQDHAIWRRLRLVPFTVTIPEADRDPHLLDKLKAEAPGILRWAVEGCRAWQRDGLRAPGAVLAATTGYREEMDALGDFIADELMPANVGRTTNKAMRARYQEWCDRNGLGPMNTTAFSLRMQEHGFAQYRHGSGRGWDGVLLIDHTRGDEVTGFPGIPDNSFTSDFQGAHTENTVQPVTPSLPETWTGPQRARFEELRRTGLTSKAAAERVLRDGPS